MRTRMERDNPENAYKGTGTRTHRRNTASCLAWDFVPANAVPVAERALTISPSSSVNKKGLSHDDHAQLLTLMKPSLTKPEHLPKKGAVALALSDPAKKNLLSSASNKKKVLSATDKKAAVALALSEPSNKQEKPHPAHELMSGILQMVAPSSGVDKKKAQHHGPVSLSEPGKVIHKKSQLTHKILSKLLQVAKPSSGKKKKKPHKLHKVVDDKSDESQSHTALDELFLKHKSKKINIEKASIAARWPLGVIPYRIDSESYDNILASRVRDQMDELEGVSCLQFKRIVSLPSPGITENRTWIHFTNPKKQRECSHHPIYTQSGEVQIILGLDCLKSRDLIHSLLHAVGFKDEVVHPRRGQYIRILWENIQPKYRSLFAMSNGLTFISEYDPMSVMHFHDRAFSKNGQATIAALVPGLQVKPSHKLSQLDKMKLRMAFGHECNRRRVDEIMDTCKNVLHEEAKKEEKAVEGQTNKVENDDDEKKHKVTAESDEDGTQKKHKVTAESDEDGKTQKKHKVTAESDEDGTQKKHKVTAESDEDGKTQKKHKVTAESDEDGKTQKKHKVTAESDEDGTQKKHKVTAESDEDGKTLLEADHDKKKHKVTAESDEDGTQKKHKVTAESDEDGKTLLEADHDKKKHKVTAESDEDGKTLLEADHDKKKHKVTAESDEDGKTLLEADHDKKKHKVTAESDEDGKTPIDGEKDEDNKIPMAPPVPTPVNVKRS